MRGQETEIIRNMENKSKEVDAYEEHITEISLISFSLRAAIYFIFLRKGARIRILAEMNLVRDH